jgi:hypothetical protein
LGPSIFSGFAALREIDGEDVEAMLTLGHLEKWLLVATCASLSLTMR